MKRKTNIYDKIYDIDNIRLAHKNAQKDKLFYREVKMVDSNPDYFFNIIHDMLKNDKYIVSDYSISIINDKGKERELMKLPYYPDRIIQWAIMLQLEEIFIKNFCNHTCASVKGRGIHYATKLTRSYLKDTTNTQYCLKFDINKFYPSIDHNILKTLLKHKFKDKRLLRLLFLIIDSHPKKQGHVSLGVGYIRKVQGTNQMGFLPKYIKDITGSSTTYYTDYGFVTTHYVPVHGGASGERDSGGIFHEYFVSPSTTVGFIGARLMYL